MCFLSHNAGIPPQFETQTKRPKLLIGFEREPLFKILCCSVQACDIEAGSGSDAWKRGICLAKFCCCGQTKCWKQCSIVVPRPVLWNGKTKQVERQTRHCTAFGVAQCKKPNDPGFGRPCKMHPGWTPGDKRFWGVFCSSEMSHSPGWRNDIFVSTAWADCRFQNEIHYQMKGTDTGAMRHKVSFM